MCTHFQMISEDCENADNKNDHLSTFMHPYGSHSTALGVDALGVTAIKFSDNTAIGRHALDRCMSGIGNYAGGCRALESLEHGSHNISVGSGAGSGYVNDSHNICIGHPGIKGDKGRVRLGTRGVNNVIDMPRIIETPLPTTPLLDTCTITAEGLMTGLIHRKVNADSTWRLDSADALVNDIAGVQKKDSICFTIINGEEQSVGAEPQGESSCITIAAGTGGSTVGNMVVMGSGQFMLQFTSVAADDANEGDHKQYVVYRMA